MARKLTAYVATAPNGAEYHFNAATKPAAVRFLDISHYSGQFAPDPAFPYIVSTHRSESAAQTSFQTPAWRPLTRHVVTDIREA